MSYLTGVVSGTASIGSALVLGASGNISGISSLSATNLTGTLATASQPNITSLGSLTGLTIGGNLSFSGSSRSISITGVSSYIDCREYRQSGVSYDLSTFMNGTVSYGMVQASSIWASDPSNCTQIPYSYDAGASNAILFADKSRIYLDGSNNSYPLWIDSGFSPLIISNYCGEYIWNTSVKNFQIDCYYNQSGIKRSTTFGVRSIPGGSSNSQSNCVLGTNDSTMILTTRLDAGNYSGIIIFPNQTSPYLSKIAFNDSTMISNSFYSFNGPVAIKSSTSMWADGSSSVYSVAQQWQDDASSPAKIQMQIANNGAGALLGTYTTHPFGLMISNATALYINTNRYVGIGTTSPLVPLHVSTTATYAFGAGGTTVYRLQTSSGVTESALGPISYNVSALFGGYVGCTALAMTSDRRLKRNIQSCPIDRVKRLYDSCDVKLYEWIESENKPGQEVGLIAQDLVSAHLTDLTSVFYRDDIEGGEDSTLEPDKAQLNVDYRRIAAYNMKMIQHLLDRIEELEAKVSSLI
ncbi:hypothetical protein PC110_g22317 [Phytophthora cactorum]|uniref:Peptidase S74 domain-containing protein n=1 Tax=Phytophthora cactorum TaxID=29920 RepID=A0A329RA01_9STRA|nr:hypothetical protein PC110_g22317 [Phytophthora cactorum]